MKARQKTYSLVLMVALVSMLAHIFVPHHDKFGGHQTSLTAEDICKCLHCENDTSDTIFKVVSHGADSGCCDCCEGSGKNCFLSSGFIHTNSDDCSAPLIFFDFICQNIIYLIVNESIEHLEFNTPYHFALRLNSDIQGIGMRAPPIYC